MTSANFLYSSCVQKSISRFFAVAIADRVGHESIDITYRYAHLFPSTQNEMADKLSDLRSDDTEGDDEDVSEES